MTDAIIFDLDGTIVLSHPTHFEAYEKLFAEFGVTWNFKEFEQVFAGTGAPGIINNILTRNGIKDFDLLTLVKRKRDIYNEILQEKCLATVPGFFEFLESIKKAGLKKIIASGSARANIFQMLRNIGVEKDFPEVVSGEEVALPKPAPDIFLVAAQRIGVAPANCWVIEDTEHGVRGAKAAGMKCVALLTTSSHNNLQKAGADLIVDNYTGFNLSSLEPSD